jgi:hypothetical protein
VFFSYHAMVYLLQSPNLRFFGEQTKWDRIFSFVVPYRVQCKVSLRTINFILENTSKLLSLHFSVFNSYICIRKDIYVLSDHIWSVVTMHYILKTNNKVWLRLVFEKFLPIKLIFNRLSKNFLSRIFLFQYVENENLESWPLCKYLICSSSVLATILRKLTLDQCWKMEQRSLSQRQLMPSLPLIGFRTKL